MDRSHFTLISELSVNVLNENTLVLPVQDLVCSICGENHETAQCSNLRDCKTVPDTKTVSRARLTLPSNLEVKTLADGSTTVIATAKFEAGTQFGPFQAPLTIHMHPAISFPLKVFPENVNDGYYLDTTDEESCNWMCLVAAATISKHQNLICYDIKQNIYFSTSRDVLPGDELRVWYALYYGLKLQVLPLADDLSEEEELWDIVDDKIAKTESQGCCLQKTLAQQLPAETLGAVGKRDSWTCRLCGSEESCVVNFARHLMTHHRRRAPQEKLLIQCKICQKNFFSDEALGRHQESRHCENLLLPEMSVSEAPQHSSPTLMVIEQTSNGNPNSNEFLQLHKKEIVCTSTLKDSLLTSKENSHYSKKLLSLADVSSAELHNLCSSINVNSTSKNFHESSGKPIDMDCEKNSDIEDRNSQCSTIVNDINTSGISRSSTFVEHTRTCSEDTYSTSNDRKIFSPLSNCDPEGRSHSFQQGDNTENIAADSEIFLGSTSKITLSEFSCDKHDNNASTAQLFVRGEDGIPLSTTFSLNEDENIKLALENGEPVAFILMDCPENEDLPVDVTNPSQEVENNHELNANENNSDKSDHEDLNLEERGENSSFTCDICDKTFQKSSYLYRHLRKHTGEFTCVTCQTVFARKENLQSHSCARPMTRYPCPSCGKKFSTKKYLLRHIPLHTGEFTCHTCKRQFVSRISLAAHRCASGTETVGDVLSCFLCQRLFMSQVKLQAHLKRHYVSLQSSGTVASNLSSFHATHLSQKNKLGKTTKVAVSSKSREFSSIKDFVCEVCGATFKSSSSMKTHRFLHEERRFECEVCKKKFHRKDVLQDHLTVHQEAKLPCHICGKKYKTKKSLDVHMAIHNGSKRFTCEECGKEFFQKGNLIKHQLTHSSEREFPCQYCKKKFTSKEYFNIHVLEHTQGKIHSCSICKKSFVKKHLLESHQQSCHSNKGFLCKFCNCVMRRRHSARRHLEMRHHDLQQEWAVPSFLDSLLVELPEFILHPSADNTQTSSQQRQKVLQSLRGKHFNQLPEKLEAPPLNEDLDSTSDFLYTIVPPSDFQVDQLAQGDPLVMLQPTKQLTIFDNYPTDSTSHTPGPPIIPLGDGKGSEILLTMVESSLPQDSIEASESISSSVDTGTDCHLSISEGTTYVVEDETGASNVFYYVVEAGSDLHGTDAEDML